MKERVTEAQALITALLADGNQHHISEIHALLLDYEAIEEALEQLINEETVIDDDGYLMRTEG